MNWRWYWILPSEFICLGMLIAEDQRRRFETMYDSKLQLFALGFSDEFTERRIKKLFDRQGVTYEVTN